MRLTNLASEWYAGGKTLTVDGVGLYYRLQGSGRPLVCLHGFPTSSWDWHRILPLLSASRRVLVFDFPGYGLSEKPPQRDYSLLRQADATEALLQRLNITDFDVLCHDMGNSVLCELLHRIAQVETDLQIGQVIMLNGGVYMDLHQPLLTQKLLRTPVLGALTARLSSYQVFKRQYPKVYANPTQFDEVHYQTQWSLLLHNQGRAVLHPLAGYMRERLRYTERWLGSLHRAQLPIRLLWGREDPIAVATIAEKLEQNLQQAELVYLDQVGHYPQLEAPQRTAEGVLAALQV